MFHDDHEAMAVTTALSHLMLEPPSFRSRQKMLGWFAPVESPEVGLHCKPKRRFTKNTETKSIRQYRQYQLPHCYPQTKRENMGPTNREVKRTIIDSRGHPNGSGLIWTHSQEAMYFAGVYWNTTLKLEGLHKSSYQIFQVVCWSMLMHVPRVGTQERTACNRARQVRMSSLGPQVKLREKNLSDPSMTYKCQDETKYKRTNMYNCIT